MTIKVGKEFSFEFTNSEPFKKKLSPSQNRRNFERHEHFLEKKIIKNVDKVSKATIVESIETLKEIKNVSVQNIENKIKHEIKETQTQTSHSYAKIDVNTTGENLKTSTDVGNTNDDIKEEVSKTIFSPRSLKLNASYKCYLCAQISGTKSDLMRHHDFAHKDKAVRYTCERCDEN